MRRVQECIPFCPFISLFFAWTTRRTFALSIVSCFRMYYCIRPFEFVFILSLYFLSSLYALLFVTGFLAVSFALLNWDAEQTCTANNSKNVSVKRLRDTWDSKILRTKDSWTCLPEFMPTLVVGVVMFPSIRLNCWSCLWYVTSSLYLFFAKFNVVFLYSSFYPFR